MFYPVDSLKRGGRFYLCWVADSWPLRFATITHRQLWSQDVRKICDDLRDVISNESGRPTRRFSLRLSSQLMRGLVRLYQRKVTVFLSDLCMINANVTKHINHKFNVQDENEVQRPVRSRPQTVVPPLPQITLPEEPEEQQIEEIIQNSGNAVANIQQITLKEATIPEFQLPQNDGFGEENPEQALQMLADRTVETMMVPTDAPAHISGLDLLDVTDKSHETSRDLSRDRSRLQADRQMERISELELTMFGKSPRVTIEKDTPEISLYPDISILPQENLPVEQENVEMREAPIVAPSALPEKQPTTITAPTAQEPDQIQLEELEASEPLAKRRRLRRLIIDKKTRLGADFLRARLADVRVELRCENTMDDIIGIRVPCAVYMRRLCHAGFKITSNIALDITRLFERNLGEQHRSPRTEKEFQEEIMFRRPRIEAPSMLERIEEVDEPIQERPPPATEMEAAKDITYPEITVTDISKDNLPETGGLVLREINVEESLTKKIDTLSLEARKRSSARDDGPTPKKLRSGVLKQTQKDGQQNMETTVQMVGEPEMELVPTALEIVDKENVPANMQDTIRPQAKDAVMSITSMLQTAGLADMPTCLPEVEQPAPATSQRKSSRIRESGSTETPLGSLDRTKVSLGESEETTDSRMFIRDQWGTEGTMIKILKSIKNELQPVTVRTLISRGPVIAEYKNIIAARCFTSILKLKQHGFITIKKCPGSLEIEDIELGPMFD